MTGHKMNAKYTSFKFTSMGEVYNLLVKGSYAMADEEFRSAARRFFTAYPEFHQAMSESKIFPKIRDQARIAVDAEDLYITRGDTLGEEEDLYLEALIRGALRQGDLDRALLEELDDRLKNIIRGLSGESGGYSNE